MVLVEEQGAAGVGGAEGGFRAEDAGAAEDDEGLAAAELLGGVFADRCGLVRQLSAGGGARVGLPEAFALSGCALLISACQGDVC